MISGEREFMGTHPNRPEFLPNSVNDFVAANPKVRGLNGARFSSSCPGNPKARRLPSTRGIAGTPFRAGAVELRGRQGPLIRPNEVAQQGGRVVLPNAWKTRFPD